MNLGSRLGDPIGAVEDADCPSLTNVRLRKVPSQGAWAYKLTWDFDGGFMFGDRGFLGDLLGGPTEYFKVYVNGQLVSTQRARSYSFRAPDSGQVAAAVVVVGPKSGDPGYLPVRLDVVPGNRVQLTWARPVDDDGLYEFRVYWDAGGGTVDYTAGNHLAVVRDDASATFTWTSAPLADGTYKFAVRSRDNAGNEDTNSTEVSVVIATWPAQPSALAYSYDPDTDKVTLTWSGGATCNIYSNGGSGDIDYDTAEAAGQTTGWASAALTGPGTFKYAVRADNGVYEEGNTDYVEFELDAAEDEVTQPASPYGLTVEPTAAGEFIVSGYFDARRPTLNGGQAAVATEIRVYDDAGTGTVDYNTTVKTASLTYQAGQYRWTVTTDQAGYSHGQEIIFAARAATAGGVVDDNTDTAAATADDDAPGAPTSLAGSAVRSKAGSR